MFWNTVAVKQSKDITRLQALVDRKKVVVTEVAIRDALRLDDAEGVDCLPNEEIFTELARMGYEKSSTKLTYYKAFFSSQWKFLIHTILQSMSAKCTSWNEFSSTMASVVICLSTGRKFNFSKYIFESLVRNVDISSKFNMYPRFIHLIIQNQLGDLSTYTTKYISSALTQKVFANMRRVGKGCFGVETPLFKGMLVAREPEEQGDVEEQGTDDNAAEEPDTADSEDDSKDITRLQALVDRKKVVVTEVAIRDALRLDDAEGVDCLPNEEILLNWLAWSMSAKCTSWNEFSSTMASVVICLSTEEQGTDDNAAEEPDTADSEDDEALNGCASLARRVEHLEHDKVGTSQRVDTSGDTIIEDISNQGRMIDELDRDEGVVLMSEKEEKKVEEVKDITGDAQAKGRQAKIYQIDMDHAAKVLSMQDDEPELQEAVEVVTTAKLITEVVAAVSEAVSAARPNIAVVVVPAATITVALVKVAAASTRRRRGVVIRDTKEESTAKIPNETKSKDKGKGIMVEEPKPMKKKRQVEMDEAYARKLHEELNQDIDWDVSIDHVKQKDKEDPFNTAGFRLDYFKGMSYDDICPIFEANFNANMKFLLKSKEQIEEEANRALKSINETPAQKSSQEKKDE
nr:hypothetical protein [Tanacetum cinerariifolium]